MTLAVFHYVRKRKGLPVIQAHCWRCGVYDWLHFRFRMWLCDRCKQDDI